MDKPNAITNARRPKGGSDNDRRYTLLAMKVVGEFGFIIAVPAVLFTLGGKWLDARYGTKPLFLLIGFALAIGLTAYSIVKKAKAFEEEYRSIGKGGAPPAEPGKNAPTVPRP